VSRTSADGGPHSVEVRGTDPNAARPNPVAAQDAPREIPSHRDVVDTKDFGDLVDGQITTHVSNGSDAHGYAANKMGCQSTLFGDHMILQACYMDKGV
jgi:hypothetical protein